MFAQRVIHSLQVSRNLSTAAAALKSSRTSIIWTRPNEIDSYYSHLSSGTYSSQNVGKRVIRKVVIFMVKMEIFKAILYRWIKRIKCDTITKKEVDIYGISTGKALYH